MRSAHRHAFLVAGLAALALTTSFALSHAVAAELDGAWTNDHASCGKIFTNNGGKMGLSQNADFYGSGFVIDGNTIRGKSATCKIKSMTKTGNKVGIAATCATDVMVSDTRFDVEIGADGRLTRSFPGMPEMTMDYFRCDFSR